MYDPHHPARDTDEPREPQEPADPRRWKALAVICVAQFMLILDLTVVNVALPDLGADLDLSRTAFTWTVSAYVLFFGGLLLLGGRLADIFGTRRVEKVHTFDHRVGGGERVAGAATPDGRIVAGADGEWLERGWSQ